MDDHIATQELIEFLNHWSPKSRPFFSYYYLSSVHGYCSEQNYSLIYPQYKQSCNRLIKQNFNKELLQHRYWNAVHYMDTQVEKVLGQLKSSGLLNNTIVILTSDHGESFNEYNNNIWGHCYGYMDTLIHVPLIIHWPKKSSFTIKGQTTHYDLAATVIKYLNQQKLEMNYTIGHDLFHPQKREFIISGSYIDSAITSSNLTTVFNSSGKLLLFNPKGKLVENIKPNKIHIAKALKRMKQFYQE